jgi:hypothetical protein
MDQSKKTMRHFYCRDVLWETFEQMANDFDCSIDYLINEAMRYYARSKNYHSAQAGTGNEFRGSTGPGGSLGTSPPTGAYPSAPGGRRTQPPPPPVTGRATTIPPMERAQSYSNQATPDRGVPAVPRRPHPPAPRPSAPHEAVAAVGSATLFLVFNSQKMPFE